MIDKYRLKMKQNLYEEIVDRYNYLYNQLFIKFIPNKLDFCFRQYILN